MTWKQANVAIFEQRPEYGGAHVVGVVEQRHCGCEARLGMRLDSRETTFGVNGCEQHGVHAARALDAFTNMPPQDENVFSLWRRLLEREIDAVPA